VTVYESTSYRVRQLFSTLALATASNPVLLEGEKWNEKDPVTGRATGRSKTGDGVLSVDRTTITGTAFNDLPFDPGGEGGGGATASYQRRNDSSNPAVVYTAKAAAGTADSGSSWLITRHTYSAAGVPLAPEARATGAWSNRTQLAYS
jgi:hypothetical protein